MESCYHTHLIIFSSCHFQFFFVFVLSRSLAWGQARIYVWECDEYLKYSFYPSALVSFSSVFMLNKCPNALKVHTYDQVIHLVELCKIGEKTAIEAVGEAIIF